MKRLRFKTPFNGMDNALKLIPESYKVNGKEFELTDGIESYRVRWEKTPTILTASNKNLINEDMQKMKHLMQYNSKDTLGNLRGKERINENKVFNDVWDKTKSINEIFGFGKKKPQKWEVANKYVPQLKELYREMKSHKGNLIDYEMISDARMTLMKFNDILDEILNDKDAELYKQYYPDDWGGNNSAFEWLESTKRNVEKDSSGRNRPNGLYLGDTSGLHTLEARDWLDKKDDVRQIIGNQLTGWLLSNINAAIVLLTESENKSIDEMFQGFGFTNEGNLEENEEDKPKKKGVIRSIADYFKQIKGDLTPEQKEHIDKAIEIMKEINKDNDKKLEEDSTDGKGGHEAPKDKGDDAKGRTGDGEKEIRRKKIR